MKKVPLVHYVDGERIEIGEAVVDIGEGFLDVSATVTNPDYIPRFTPDVRFLSIGYEARGGEYMPFETNIPKVKTDQPVHIRATGKGPIPDGNEEAEARGSNRKERKGARRGKKGRSRRPRG